MKTFVRYFVVLVPLIVFSIGHAVEVDQGAVQEAKAAFLDRMVATHGLDRAELTRILDDAEIDEQILETISRPAERVLPWHEYRAIFLNETRISGGVEFWNTHADEIRNASEAYSVAPELLVAILGVETYYGRRMGSFRVIDSLATLAFAYPPRSEFFTSELEAFFLLVVEEGIDAEQVLGSYAGAMGAGQFISSSYRAYAVDGNDDGRRDLWGDWQDVLASVANYFSAHGWRRDKPVVSRASLSQTWSGPEPTSSMNLEQTVSALSDAGYIFSTEQPGEAPATVLSLEGQGQQEYWVGYHNFHVITRYNRSVMYALAVYQLGQAILAGYERGPVEAPSEGGE